MSIRWKTIGGLLLLAVLGGGAALLFQRRQPISAAPSAASATINQFASPARGRIVPLVVDEAAPLMAFVPAARSGSSNFTADSPGRLQSLPTIRASANDEPSQTPELSQGFPRPLDFSPIEPLALAVPSDSLASTAAPTSIEKETVALKISPADPVRHVIVDGDTLPALAERYFGDRSRGQEIYEQNRDRLPSPEVLPIGVEITIRAAS